MRPGIRRWPLRRLLGSVFIALGLVTVLIVALVTTTLIHLDSARRDRVGVYGPALLATESLSKAYSDQETGVRGFVSADRQEFLVPYTQGRVAEDKQERRLRRLLADRPDLLALLAEVQAAAGVWQKTVAEPAIELTTRKGPRSNTVDQIFEGRARFNAVRAAVAKLQGPVRKARSQASEQLSDALGQLRLALLASLLLFLAVAVGTWVALRTWVTEPLDRFGREVDVVESGDLSHRVAVDEAPAEIRTLSEQVDGMRIRIVHEYALAERARDEAQLARAQVEEQAADLLRSNTELEQFAYVASHDLQEPLRKVASFCQLLERRYKGQLDERGEQYIEFAVDGAKRMQRLINDLLAFSRVGRLTTELVPVDLDEALEQAERQLAETLEEAGATVTHEELPTVDGDGTLLVQLFQNLVGNAVKFRSDAPPQVHIGVRRDGEMWEFSCSDNGIGIEEQFAEKIFVIFQRLHGRDVYGGTGIGLAMCRKIVEYHGGRIWLDADAGEGATIRWTLPVAGGEHGPATSKERMGHDVVTAVAPD